MKFAVMADCHLTNRLDTPQWAAMHWAVEEMRKANVQCALIAGDITACGDMDAAAHARDALDGFAAPWLAVPGNSDARTKDMAQAVCRLFLPPPGGRLVGGIRVLGIDTSGYTISPVERARMQIAPRDCALILVSHQGYAHIDEDSRAFLLNWIRARESAGQSILYWFSGHTHARAQSTFAGVRCVTLRALDPDKSIGGLPEILILDTETGEIMPRAFTRGLLPDWSASERDEFRHCLGISCYRIMDDMRFCINNGVRHIEWRDVCDPDDEARALLAKWRRAGGRTFSMHLSPLTWDGERAQTTGNAQLAKTVKFAINMGADMATVHPPYESMDTMRIDAAVYDALADRMAEILRPLADAGIRILVENNHTRAGDSAENRHFGCTPTEVVGWMDALNARLGARACALRLDVGHARNNAPIVEFCPLGHWYALTGARCMAYHLHQTRMDASGRIRNHFPITGLDDGLVCYHGFMWAWRAGILTHGPLILEVHEGFAAPETYLRLCAILKSGAEESAQSMNEMRESK